MVNLKPLNPTEFVPNNNDISNSFNNTQQIVESTDLAEVMKNLDQDVETEQGMNSIDFNTRLTFTQIPTITGLETLCAMGVFPKKAGIITRKVKRNLVSLGGEGRKEKVDITRNEREHEQLKGGQSVADKIGGMFKQGQQ